MSSLTDCLWLRQYANLWRTTPDTSNTYESMLTTALVNNNATQIVPGATGAWNDADMLEVGNFFSEHVSFLSKNHHHFRLKNLQFHRGIFIFSH